jgi:uncharacterized Zn-binding protein involved in type VI secretion
MGVTVHHRRAEQEAVRVDHLVADSGVHGRAQLGDHPVLHPQADHLPAEHCVGDREAQLSGVPVARAGSTDSSAADRVFAVRSRPC